jgi:hypothetical protein
MEVSIDKDMEEYRGGQADQHNFFPEIREFYSLTSLTEGILRKLQNVMKLTQMWTDFETNGTT